MAVDCRTSLSTIQVRRFPVGELAYVDRGIHVCPDCLRVNGTTQTGAEAILCAALRACGERRFALAARFAKWAAHELSRSDGAVASCQSVRAVVREAQAVGITEDAA